MQQCNETKRNEINSTPPFCYSTVQLFNSFIRQTVRADPILSSASQHIFLNMSLFLVALLIAANNDCASSYKPTIPKFISSKIDSIQAQSSKFGKVLGSIVIAASLVNLPLGIDQANAVDRYNNKLNAPTAIGTRVNSDAESLLRYGELVDATFFSLMTWNY